MDRTKTKNTAIPARLKRHRLFALALLCGFFAPTLHTTPAHAACAAPIRNAGALEFFVALNRHLYCDGTTWLEFSQDVWQKNPSDQTKINYPTGDVGVGINPPIVDLDIAGNLRLGYDAQICAPAIKGAIRYDATNKTYSYCDGGNWVSFISGSIPAPACEVVTYTTPGYYSYTVMPGCTNLIFEAWGAGGGATPTGIDNGAAGGGASWLETGGSILALGGGGGGGAYAAYFARTGAGGGGGYGRTVSTLTAGDTILIGVGQGGQKACSSYGGTGGEISPGLGGGNTFGGSSTYGGGGGGIGDIALWGSSGSAYSGPGTSPESGPGVGANNTGSCLSVPSGRGGNGQVKITPGPMPDPGCAAANFTTPGYYLYRVSASCPTLVIDAYGAGGGAGYFDGGGGGGGSSRVVRNTGSTILVVGGGGGGGGSSYTATERGGGGGGGWARKTQLLSAGEYVIVSVGRGGQNGCADHGGEGGEPESGLAGGNGAGLDSVNGGGGGGDYGGRGGSSTYGGAGGGGDGANNGASNSVHGGAGGARPGYACGTSTNGGACNISGGGGGSGIGDTTANGSAGTTTIGGAAANSGPGTGAPDGTGCGISARGGPGRVLITPQ